MAELIGLPAPPEVGASALPGGTYDGAVVFVTGSGTGLGKGIAVEFARLGAAVVVASRKEEHLAAGKEAIEAVGGRALAVTCDIRDADTIAAAFDAAEAELGLPDVLVKGSDYSVDQVVGAPEVVGAGGRVVLAPLVPGHSTTTLLQRAREPDA